MKKRIEDLENDWMEKARIDDNQWCSVIAGQITALEQILSKSTPLIPKIENSIIYGFNIGGQISKLTPKMLQDYISNLKLDI